MDNLIAELKELGEGARSPKDERRSILRQVGEVLGRGVKQGAITNSDARKIESFAKKQMGI